MTDQEQKPLRQIVQERLENEKAISVRGKDFADDDRQIDVAVLPEDLFQIILGMAMSNPIYHVEEFHRKFGLHVHEECVVGQVARKFRHGMNYNQLADLRNKLLDEEFNTEYLQADNDMNEMEMLDALCDIIYVAVGAALEFGLPIRLGMEEVHSSNMSKLDANGKPILREDGKILKGENYAPPNWIEVFRQWEKERGKV